MTDDIRGELDSLHDLLNKFSTMQSRITDVHKAKSLDDAFRALARIFSEVLEVSAVKCLEWTPVDGKYPETFFEAESHLDFSGIEDDAGLVEWAVENGSVMLVPVEEQQLIDQQLRSMVIMPIKGEQGYAVYLMWVKFGEKTASKFVTDLLRNTAREMAGICDNKTLLERVRSVHELMDNIVESVPQGIFAIDRNDEIVACNRDVEILFGVRRVDLVGSRYQEGFPEEVATFLSDLVIRTLNGAESADHELTLRPGGDVGQETQIGISTSLLYDREGSPHGLVFICRDLSLSLEVQRLREIDVMKSEFIHTVSHELKTPLTAIMGGAELLVALKDEMPEECADMVEIIDEGGKRLHTLIMDLLDLSRLESGKVSMDQQICDLSPMIRDTVELVRSRNPRITWNLDRLDEELNLLADPLKMKQVLENFIGNAAKYSPEGGEVTISSEVHEDQLTLRVADQGLGIPEDQVPLVWDKFYRVDSSTTAEIEGTGLGLPIVKHIVDMHGGEVHLESTLGEGSTFSFSVPMRV